ncbi:MAG: hypothetical protein HQ556_13510 [Candidatus Marinimicrobia bacterium]|nr:hypothetical protein [Candidatus Neomarinimicrobiota bacterium]
MKNVDRTKIIMEYASSRTSVFEYSLVPALVNCLDPDEVIQMLSVCDEQDANVRRALLNKMERDVSENVARDKYHKLGPILIDRYESALAKKRGAIRTCLDRILNVFSDETVKEILIYLLTNKHVGMRRKAFAYLKQNWSDPYRELLMEAWEKYSDPEANTLVVSYLDEKIIGVHLEKILAIVETTKYKIPVYKKLAAIDMKHVSHLDSTDKITATYLRAINKIKIPQKSAKKLVVSELTDERYGLLLWSLGRLGHWSALLHAHDLLKRRYGL